MSKKELAHESDSKSNGIVDYALYELLIISFVTFLIDYGSPDGSIWIKLAGVIVACVVSTSIYMDVNHNREFDDDEYYPYG